MVVNLVAAYFVFMGFVCLFSAWFKFPAIVVTCRCRKGDLMMMAQSWDKEDGAQ